jgi:hypothetical protein
MRGRNNNGGGNNNNNNNNNNRRGPNPLTRNYESNGPDVKIRGSAQQIAEKYATLARDAQSAGDRVMAENYLQHAEHYNRIIAAAQAQMPIQQAQHNRDDIDDDVDQDRDDFEVNGAQPSHQAEQAHSHQAPAEAQAAPQTVEDGSGPQPVIDGTPAEVALKSEAPAPARGRGRRAAPKPTAERNDDSAPAEAASPVAEAVSQEAAEPKDEEAAAPRRSRRPRRGERRGDEEAVSASGGDAAANDANSEKPAGDSPAGDTVLAAANS